jgi:mannose-6-phosphate isomerase-like protein (cupin superfamily)
MNAGVKKYSPYAEYYFKEGCFITELSNSEDDSGVSIARARVEPGKATRWHRLRGISERYVVIEGEGLVEIGTSEPQVVTRGDVVLIPAEQRQRISNQGEEDLIFLAICNPAFVTSAYQDLE